MKVALFGLLLILSAQADLWESKNGGSFEGEIAGRDEDAIYIRPDGSDHAIKVPRSSLASDSLTAAEEWLAVEQNQKRSQWRRALWRPWPKMVGIRSFEVSELVVGRVFRSKHYRLESDYKLDKASAETLLETAENQWRLCERLALYFPRQARFHDELLDIRLFAEKEAYRKAGGAVGTAAMHLSRWQGSRRNIVFDAILIPRSTLVGDADKGVERGRIGVVRHELVHQLMGVTQKSDPWRMEGVAEFVSTIPREGGRYRLDRHRKAIVRHLSAPGNGGHRLALGKRIELPKLEKLLKMDLKSLMMDSRTNYAASLLLVEFLATSDEGLLQEHFEMIAEGKLGNANARLFLLCPVLEAEIVERWKPLGLSVSFK